MKIFVIAGEASGDQLGAAVLKSLHNIEDEVIVRGIGSAEMARAGMGTSLFPMEELSLMGITEIVPEIPNMLKRIRQTVAAIRGFNPDIVLSIDCPEFSLRVQKKLRDVKCPAQRVHMVAPTVWAWRPGRAKKMADYLDAILCLFPFEPKYFEQEGLKAKFIGHTMMNSGVLYGNGGAFRFRNMLSHDRKIVGIFFGSRSGEIDQCADIILDTAKQLHARHPDIYFIAPTIPRWKEWIEDKLKQNNLPAMVTADPIEKWDAFSALNAAVAVSGTVALEIAVARIPHVIMYRANKFTWTLLQRLVKTPYAHLANILLGRAAIPEFLQDNATSENIVTATENLLFNDEARALQLSDLAHVRDFLLPADNKKPADVAAGFLSDLIK